MKIACTGSSGKVGQRLVKMGVIPLECDVTDFAMVNSVVTAIQPDVIVHLAALSDVDYCEAQENKEKVIKVNLRGAANVATAALENHCGVVLLSTDHVFDGKRGPYKETDRPKNPVNFYGMSKMGAEALTESFSNMKIVRTSHLFNYNRIFHTFIDPDKFYGKVEVPTFLRRSFMYEGHFATCLYVYLLRFFEMPKVFHISGSDTVSMYDYALAVASIFGIDKSHIIPRKKELKELAPRPKKAGLNTKLSSRFLQQFNYIDGLKALKAEQG